MSEGQPVYKRILLKLSGEALRGELPYGIDFKRAGSIAHELNEIHNLGVDIAIMIGGGNIFRGSQGVAEGMDRVTADHIGLLATVINGLALQDALEKKGLVTRLISAIEIKAVAEPFIRRRVVRHLEKGRVVVFTGGLGSPYFTTDTAAVLRALEIKAEVILKATKVDGVYSADPMVVAGATRFESIKFLEVMQQELKVMDSTAISLCKDNNLPIIVFNLSQPGNIMKAVLGQKVGTKVS
ncbi:MAG TPA: UMP kinase [Candidatus Saccharicenans sp.]|nr:UMP kinase [Candidatus Saccharicenans sp.]HRD02771.1 UMP kinase [Candidatus Saccharicenans sp.]